MRWRVQWCQHRQHICSSLWFFLVVFLFSSSRFCQWQAALDLRAHMYHVNTAWSVNEPFWTWAHHLSLAAGVTCFPISIVTERQEICIVPSCHPQSYSKYWSVSHPADHLPAAAEAWVEPPEGAGGLYRAVWCRAPCGETALQAVKNSSIGLHCRLTASRLLPLVWFW